MSIFNMIAGGGGAPTGLEYETGTWTPTQDTTKGTVMFSNTHTEAPSLIQLIDVGTPQTLTNDSNVFFAYMDMYKIFGQGVPYGKTGNYFRYSFTEYGVIANSASVTNLYSSCTGNNSSKAGESTDNYPRFFAKEDRFCPYAGSTSRYWRANRSYKWIAIWV